MSTTLTDELWSEVTAQFAPFIEAEKLKQLGYSGVSFGQYEDGELKSKPSYKEGVDIVPAPLWQQAFDWFAEKYKLEVAFAPDSLNDPKKKFRQYTIHSIDKSIILEEYVDQKYWKREGLFKTRAEAKKAALKKLIYVVEAL